MIPEIVLALDVPQLLNLLLAVIFPVLVGLVTTKVTSSTLKAVLLASISLASGLVSALLTTVIAGVPFDLIAALLTGFAAWIIALATHLGFWKPTGVTEVVQSIGSPPVGDGFADDRRAIQKLIDKGGVVVLGVPASESPSVTITDLDSSPKISFEIPRGLNVNEIAAEADAAVAASIDRAVSDQLRRDLRGA